MNANAFPEKRKTITYMIDGIEVSKEIYDQHIKNFKKWDSAEQEDSARLWETVMEELPFSNMQVPTYNRIDRAARLISPGLKVLINPQVHFVCKN